MSSVTGTIPKPKVFGEQIMMYSLCKGFIRFFTLGLAEEISSKVDVISVQPGAVTTPMIRGYNGFGSCMPSVTVAGVFRDLGKINETYSYLLQMALNLLFFGQNTRNSSSLTLVAKNIS